MATLDLWESNVMWVASNFSGAAGFLGAEAIELSNWLLNFRCALEEFIFVVSNLDEWIDNFSPPPGLLTVLCEHVA